MYMPWRNKNTTFHRVKEFFVFRRYPLRISAVSLAILTAFMVFLREPQ
jgi:hypothetical protein